MARVYVLHLQSLADQLEDRPNLLHRAPTLEEMYPSGPPDIVLGSLGEREDVPVGISLSGPAHQLFAGMTGTGKTTAMRRELVEIDARNRKGESDVVVLVFDRKGVDFVGLGRSLGWDIYDIEEGVRLGLQAPAGCPPRKWASYVASALASRAGLVYAESTFANAVRWLVGALNNGNGAQRIWPSLPLVLEVLHELPERAFSEQPQYTRSLLHMLEPLVEGTGELFQTFGGLDVERHLVSRRKSAVIRMPMMSPPWVRQFVVDLIVLQLLIGRMHRGQTCSTLQVLLVIDEADADVSGQGEQAFPGGMSPISLCMRMGREFGLGVVLGLGSLDAVARHATNSAAFHFLFKTPDSASTMATADTLLLPRGAEAMVPALQTGECLFRGPSWPHAVLAKIDPIFAPPDNGATADTHPFVPARTLSELPEVAAAIRAFSGKQRRRRATRAVEKYSKLSDTARQLLVQWSCAPFTPVARLYDMIGRPSPEKERAVREALRDGGYAEFEEIRIGKRNMALFEPKEAAWTLLGKPPIELRGRGGVAHRHIAHWIASVVAKRGFEDVRVEWQVPSTRHSADAAWRDGAQWHSAEVVVGCQDNLIAHLDTTLLASGAVVASVTIVAAQKAQLKQLRSRVEQCTRLTTVLDRIHYIPVETYLKELWP